MDKKELIITIIKTALSTLPLVFGLLMTLGKKEGYENFVGRLVSIRDLELSTSNYIFFKVVGICLLITGLALGFYFFLYDPDAAAREAAQSY